MQDINYKKWDRKFYKELEKKNVSQEIVDEIKKDGISSQYGAFVLASALEGCKLTIGHCQKDFWWVEYCGNIIDCENKKVYLKDDFCAVKLFDIDFSHLKDDGVADQLAYLSIKDEENKFELLSKLRKLNAINEKQEAVASKLILRDIATKLNKKLEEEEANEKKNISYNEDEVFEEKIKNAKRIVRELNKNKTKQK